MHQKSSSENTHKLDEYQKRIVDLEQENKNLFDQFQDVESRKSAQIAELQIMLKEFESKSEAALSSVTKLEEEKRAIEENFVQNAAKTDENFKEMLDKISNEKIELETKFNEKEQEMIQNYEQKVAALEENNKILSEQFTNLDADKSAQIAELQDKLKELEEKCEAAYGNVTKLEEEKRVIEQNHNESMQKADDNFKEMEIVMLNEKVEMENQFKAKEQELSVILNTFQKSSIFVVKSFIIILVTNLTNFMSCIPGISKNFYFKITNE